MTPETIYNHRKYLKMKRAEFARTIGIAPRTLKAYEEGTTHIPLYIALAIKAVRQDGLEKLCEDMREVFGNFEKM